MFNMQDHQYCLKRVVKMLYLLLIIATILAGWLLFYFDQKYKYWARRNLPHLKPKFPYGTMENSLTRKTFLSLWIKQNYDELKAQGHKHGGLYNFSNPVYLPVHPKFVKNVMQTDFHYFDVRGIYYNEKEDPLSANLIALGGAEWRNVRSKLTPVFTPGKVKSMVEIAIACGRPLLEQIEQFAKLGQPVDIKEYTARLATDTLGNCVAGFECNSFNNPDAEFRKYGQKMIKRVNFQALSSLLFMSIPQLGRLLKRREYAKDITDFFLGAIRAAVSFRTTNPVIRKDMLQILMNEMDNDENALTINQVAAHLFGFFIAGFETTSLTVTYALFELSLNQDIQDKLREEINKVLKQHNEEITYEAIAEMTYLSQVFDETLRKYPIVAHITRKCSKDYKVPGTDVVIEAGTGVFISPLGLHHDEEFYPNPEVFDPERFNEEAKQKRVPFTYLPFGEGPRMCIGLRFAVMEIKVALVMLLKKFKFTLNEQTQLPLTADPLTFGYAPFQTVLLNAEVL